MPTSQELQNKKPASMGELTAEMSRGLAVQDQRHENLWNFKPFPKYADPDPHKGYFASTKPVKFICGSNRCIAGDTPIFDPSIGAFRKVEETKSEFSVFAWNGSELVPARALAPYVKGVEQMYKVSFSNGHTLECTKNHRLLVDHSSYQPLAELTVGCCVLQPDSSLDTFLRGYMRDDLGSNQTTQDFQSGCLSGPHRDDAQPLEAKEIAADDLPSPTDVASYTSCGCRRGHSAYSCGPCLMQCRMGAKACKPPHSTLCRDVHHPSTLLHQDLDVDQSYEPKLDPCSPRCGVSSSAIRPAGMQSMPESCLHLATPVSDPSSPSTSSCALLPSQSTSLGLISCNRNMITSIEPTRKRKVWDFEVPEHHNYLAAGVINHNSGKTYAALIESVMIFTGIIPPSLHGLYAHEEELRNITSGPNRRPRSVRIIVQSMNHFADTIRPLLTGDGGFLPEAWSHWESQTHMFRGPDGSYLEIMPIDPRERDQQKTANTLRGADLDHTQIDEISAPGAYTESRARCAAKKDGPKTVTLSYCPQEGFRCWTNETLYQNVFKYTPTQDIRLSEAEAHPEIYGLIVSMKDSPLITPEEYERQKRAYKPWEVAFRVDGRYSNRTSNPFFDVETFLKWEEEERYSIGGPFIVEESKVDVENGEFKGQLIELDEADASVGGEYDAERYPVWRVWNKPTPDRKYILSVDVSEGNVDSDWHSATVWDATNQHFPFEAATLHMRHIKPGPLAVQCCCMANIYGDCLLVPESNNTGGGMFIDRARNYVNLYLRLKSGDKELEDDDTKVGWFTSKHNKGAMLDNAYRMLSRMQITLSEGTNAKGLPVYRNFCPFKSRTRLHEFISYEERIERDKDNVAKIVWGARGGAFDDMVMESVIAFRIIDHEYEKITTCKSDGKAVRVRKNLHQPELQAKNKQSHRAFQGMKKQESLRQRCNRMGPR